MGWFWADTTPAAAASQSSSMPPTHPPADASGAPPPGCPMHQRTVDAFNPHPKPPTPSQHQPPSSCPVSHGQGAHEKKQDPAQQSTLSKLNPLNYMFPDLSQDRAPHQTQALPTSREASTIPRGSGDGNWEYPSPQQMYNALLRKGYTDTDVTAVESMVSVHNFLNEGAWAEIVEWERRFGRGLGHGWQLCSQGEENANRLMAKSEAIDGAETAPTLLRFQGRPKEMTPKAAMIQTAAWLWPAKFGTEPPFDRHDWYVSRNYGGQQKQVRYVIDYYTGPPEPTGEPVFYLDVRPAATPMGSIERMIRWGGDVWWRASGGSARVASNENK